MQIVTRFDTNLWESKEQIFPDPDSNIYYAWFLPPLGAQRGKSAQKPIDISVSKYMTTNLWGLVGFQRYKYSPWGCRGLGAWIRTPIAKPDLFRLCTVQAYLWVLGYSDMLPPGGWILAMSCFPGHEIYIFQSSRSDMVGLTDDDEDANPSLGTEQLLWDEEGQTSKYGNFLVGCHSRDTDLTSEKPNQNSTSLTGEQERPA